MLTSRSQVGPLRHTLITLQPGVKLDQQQVQKTVEIVGHKLQQLQMSQKSAPKTLDDATKRKYQFWETQPVPKFRKLAVDYLLVVN